MRRLFRLIVAVLLVGGWLAFASAIHVVRTADVNFVVIPKNRIPGWRTTYVDARAWTPADAQQHPEIVDRLIESGKADRLAHVGSREELLALIDGEPVVPTAIAVDLATPTTRPTTTPTTTARHDRTTTRPYPLRHTIR